MQIGENPRTSTLLQSSAAVAESKALQRISHRSGKSQQARKKKEMSGPDPATQIGATNLCSSINLRLPRILPLAEDGGSQEFIPVLLADQVRGLEEDGCAVPPRQGLPRGFSSKGTVDSPCDGRLIRLMIGAEVSRVVRRDQLLPKLSRRDLEGLQSSPIELV